MATSEGLVNPKISGRDSDSGSHRKIVFVTVGTTRFDALIGAVDSPEFAAALKEQGYTSLVIQAGVSEGYRPHRLLGSAAVTKGTLESGLVIEWFEYCPSLAPYLDTASLVISHAGSGSIFETLRRGLLLITVPNSLLMDNHQSELAQKLEKLGHCAVATPEKLAEVVLSLEPGKFKPYVPGDGKEIVARIDALCGVKGQKVT